MSGSLSDPLDCLLYRTLSATLSSCGVSLHELSGESALDLLLDLLGQRSPMCQNPTAPPNSPALPALLPLW